MIRKQIFQQDHNFLLYMKHDGDRQKPTQTELY
jgi:hypothetical protein